MANVAPASNPTSSPPSTAGQDYPAEGSAQDSLPPSDQNPPDPEASSPESTGENALPDEADALKKFSSLLLAYRAELDGDGNGILTFEEFKGALSTASFATEDAALLGQIDEGTFTGLAALDGIGEDNGITLDALSQTTPSTIGEAPERALDYLVNVVEEFGKPKASEYLIAGMVAAGQIADPLNLTAEESAALTALEEKLTSDSPSLTEAEQTALKYATTAFSGLDPDSAPDSTAAFEVLRTRLGYELGKVTISSGVAPENLDFLSLEMGGTEADRYSAFLLNSVANQMKYERAGNLGQTDQIGALYAAMIRKDETFESDGESDQYIPAEEQALAPEHEAFVSAWIEQNGPLTEENHGQLEEALKAQFALEDGFYFDVGPLPNTWAGQTENLSVLAQGEAMAYREWNADGTPLLISPEHRAEALAAELRANRESFDGAVVTLNAQEAWAMADFLEYKADPNTDPDNDLVGPNGIWMLSQLTPDSAEWDEMAQFKGSDAPIPYEQRQQLIDAAKVIIDPSNKFKADALAGLGDDPGLFNKENWSAWADHVSGNPAYGGGQSLLYLKPGEFLGDPPEGLKTDAARQTWLKLQSGEGVTQAEIDHLASDEGSDNLWDGDDHDAWMAKLEGRTVNPETNPAVMDVMSVDEYLLRADEAGAEMFRPLSVPLDEGLGGASGVMADLFSFGLYGLIHTATHKPEYTSQQQFVVNMLDQYGRPHEGLDQALAAAKSQWSQKMQESATWFAVGAALLVGVAGGVAGAVGRATGSVTRALEAGGRLAIRSLLDPVGILDAAQWAARLSRAGNQIDSAFGAVAQANPEGTSAAAAQSSRAAAEAWANDALSPAEKRAALEKAIADINGLSSRTAEIDDLKALWEGRLANLASAEAAQARVTQAWSNPGADAGGGGQAAGDLPAGIERAGDGSTVIRNTNNQSVVFSIHMDGSVKGPDGLVIQPDPNTRTWVAEGGQYKLLSDKNHLLINDGSTIRLIDLERGVEVPFPQGGGGNPPAPFVKVNDATVFNTGEVIYDDGVGIDINGGLIQPNQYGSLGFGNFMVLSDRSVIDMERMLLFYPDGTAGTRFAPFLFVGADGKTLFALNGEKRGTVISTTKKLYIGNDGQTVKNADGIECGKLKEILDDGTVVLEDGRQFRANGQQVSDIVLAGLGTELPGGSGDVAIGDLVVNADGSYSNFIVTADGQVKTGGSNPTVVGVYDSFDNSTMCASIELKNGQVVFLDARLGRLSLGPSGEYLAADGGYYLTDGTRVSEIDPVATMNNPGLWIKGPNGPVDPTKARPDLDVLTALAKRRGGGIYDQKIKNVWEQYLRGLEDLAKNKPPAEAAAINETASSIREMIEVFGKDFFQYNKVEFEEIYKKLVGVLGSDRPILLPAFSEGHISYIEIQRSATQAGGYQIRLYDSGGGLSFFNDASRVVDGKTKYKTFEQFTIDEVKLEGVLRQILPQGTRQTTFQLYESLRLATANGKADTLSPEDYTWQDKQKGADCVLEGLNAYIRDTTAQRVAEDSALSARYSDRGKALNHEMKNAIRRQILEDYKAQNPNWQQDPQAKQLIDAIEAKLNAGDDPSDPTLGLTESAS